MARKRSTKRRTSRRYYSRAPRRRNRFTLPMAIVAGFTPTGVGVWNRRNSGTEISNYLLAGYTGMNPDGTFNFANFRVGLLPVLVGTVAHKIAGMLGLNKAIARSGIPVLRV